MALGLFHHLGTFFLFAAAVLLLITSISAPTVHSIALLKVQIHGNAHRDISFGTFGYCIYSEINGNNGETCTGTSIGYSPIELMEQLDSASYGSAATNTVDGLTRAQILHPIACGIAFIAFLSSLGASILGALTASLLAGIAWIVTLVVMVTDFVAWGILKDKVNDDGSGSSARFGVAIWTLLAAMILLFFATFLVLFSCCSARRAHRRDRVSKAEPGYAANGLATGRRRHFWQRRNRF